MNKLSWNQNPEVTNLDTALVSLGFSYHIGEVPGIKGECYIIDNYKTSEGEFFVIQEESTRVSYSVYRLFKITARNQHNYIGLEYLINDLQKDLRFYS